MGSHFRYEQSLALAALAEQLEEASLNPVPRWASKRIAKKQRRYRCPLCLLEAGTNKRCPDCKIKMRRIQ